MQRAWIALIAAAGGLILAGCAAQSVNHAPASNAAVATKHTALSTCNRSTVPAAFRAQPGYQEVFVSAVTATGDAPIKLTANDLELTQNGQPVPIVMFGAAPASVGLVVDTSGNMSPQLVQVRTLLKQIVTDLSPSDELFLMAFADCPYLLQNYTTDRTQVIKKLTILIAYGQTALYDAVLDGFLMLRHGCNERKALVLISDGTDDSSTHRPGDFESAARKMNAPILAVGIGHAKGSSSGLLALQSEGAVDYTTLSAFADATGGKAYLLDGQGGAAALNNTAAAIAAIVDSGYVIGLIQAI